jgi:hypothetical protein
LALAEQGLLASRLRGSAGRLSGPLLLQLERQRSAAAGRHGCQLGGVSLTAVQHCDKVAWGAGDAAAT